ncbi:unnamed protein product [Nesidiocoris tenuis]|uniref:Uncharacterized protein n=1 Tax=Nesidiocoris tenuis TaxID=355587 RepID=A0A6H5HNA2_9HEMI|nr:unnamed protein product [Nesidiocoris tenuis]
MWKNIGRIFRVERFEIQGVPPNRRAGRTAILAAGGMAVGSPSRIPPRTFSISAGAATSGGMFLNQLPRINQCIQPPIRTALSKSDYKSAHAQYPNLYSWKSDGTAEARYPDLRLVNRSELE